MPVDGLGELVGVECPNSAAEAPSFRKEFVRSIAEIVILYTFDQGQDPLTLCTYVCVVCACRYLTYRVCLFFFFFPLLFFRRVGYQLGCSILATLRETTDKLLFIQ